MYTHTHTHTHACTHTHVHTHTHTHTHSHTPTHPTTHPHTHLQRLRKIVEVNVQATLYMTHLIMPKMVTRKRSIVINLSSASAIKHTVLLTVYGSTKVRVQRDCFNMLLFCKECSLHITFSCALHMPPKSHKQRMILLHLL